MNIVEYKELTKNIRMTGACLSVTNQCNLRCSYCFSHANNEKMDFKTAWKAVKWLQKKSQGESLHINFFGGEPLLEYDSIIVPLVEKVEKKGMDNIRFGITTNGLRLFPHRIEWLRKHKVSILLSIDGGPKTQNTTRRTAVGEDSFDILAKNIPALLTHYPNVTFRSTVTPETVDNLYENYLWAKEMGFRHYFVMPNEFDNCWDNFYIQRIYQELEKIFGQFYDDIANEKEDIVGFSTIDKTYINLLKGGSKKDNSIFRRCGLGTTSCGIGVHGEIFGCQELNSYNSTSIFYLGNIYNEGIEPKRHIHLLNEYEKTYKNINNCVSHSHGAGFLLGEESEIARQWRQAMETFCIMFLFKAEQENNTNYRDYISNVLNRYIKEKD